MNERLQCEFHLLRYVPDPVRNVSLPIGVILRETGDAATASSKAPQVRFTRDWRQVRCLDPDADLELLEELENDLIARLRAEPDGELLSILRDSSSLCVQISDAKGYLAESIPAGMEELMRIYINPPARARGPKLSGRAAIHARMRTEFENRNVWSLMVKEIAASVYTDLGDPLKIDCGYRTNGTMKMFHAVSLEAGPEMAKVLAFSAPALHDGVWRVAKAKLDLAAIVEPDESSGDTHRSQQYEFCKGLMEKTKLIRVLPTSLLEPLAATAYEDLKV